MNRARSLAWRNRFISLCVTGLYMATARTITDDALELAQMNYGVVITLGYGHLLSAILFSRRRLAEKLAHSTRHFTGEARKTDLASIAGPTGMKQLLDFSILIGAVGLSYAAYLEILKQMPGVWLPLLAFAIWHTVENDDSLENLYRNNLQTPALKRDPRSHVASLGVSVCLASWSIAFWQPDWSRLSLVLHILTLVLAGLILLDPLQTSYRRCLALMLIGASCLAPDGSLAIDSLAFSDFFTAPILYHLISWGVVSIEKNARSDAPRTMKRDMTLIHLVPLGIMLSTFLWSGPTGAALRADFTEPSTYLFWSMIHVFQTAWVRGLKTDDPINRDRGGQPDQRASPLRPSQSRKAARST